MVRSEVKGNEFENKALYLFLIGLPNGTPLQYSCLESPMDGGAWSAAVHGVTKSRTRLSDFTFTFHFNALEKEMATRSSVLAWRIPGTEEPGRLPVYGVTEIWRYEQSLQWEQGSKMWCGCFFVITRVRKPFLISHCHPLGCVSGLFILTH